MLLHLADRKNILRYCDQDLPDRKQQESQFAFIDDVKLRSQIIQEFYIARYIYKLGEALGAEDERLLAHTKFQIVQYSSIYEAIIVHFLWTTFADHEQVKKIEWTSSLKKALSLPKNMKMSMSDGTELTLAVKTRDKVSPKSIKFDDKVDAFVKIGAIMDDLGEEIKSFNRIRNGLHLESAIQNKIKYELKISRQAFLRMQPFTRSVAGFLKNGVIPKNAKIRTRPATVKVP